PLSVPNDYDELLMISNGLTLFVDEKYGQWGLRIYGCDEVVSRNRLWKESYRRADLVYGDLIIGEFLGDSDLLIMRCDEDCDDFGSILISLPLDYRKDWYYPAASLSEFLKKYIEAEGEKFWESGNHRPPQP
ncbi:MAG: SMI1/KNR4 family protein, partial [Moraxella sp.]|nr:SMI1/KNR4 family protein [Moraxella sp.]